jgi:hypothetical protein
MGKHKEAVQLEGGAQEDPAPQRCLYRTELITRTKERRMEFALVLRELLSRKWPLALGVIVAGVAAVFSIYRYEDGKLKPKSLQYASASTQLLVDAPASVLGSIAQPFEPLSEHAAVYANFMASPAVLDLIGRQVGLQGDQIYAAGPVSANLPRVEQEPTALKRNVEITGETKPYRLNFSSTPGLPTIGVDAQAPTTNQAIALANASVTGLKQYVTNVEQSDGIKLSARVTIRQLGSASGGVVDSGIKKSLAAIVFVGVLLLWCVLLLAATRFRENWRASAAVPAAERAAASPPTAASPPDDWSRKMPGHGAGASGAPQRGTAANGTEQFERVMVDDGGATVPVRSGR